MRLPRGTGTSAIQMRLAALYFGSFIVMGSLLIALLYIQINQVLIQNTVVVRAEIVPRPPGGESESAGEPPRGVRLGLDGAEESMGHVDLAFEITQYGESRRIEVLDASANVTDANENEIVRRTKQTRFRPRVTGGRFAHSSLVRVRYYLDE